MRNRILLAGSQPELAAELVLLELASLAVEVTCAVRGNAPGAARAANTERVLARVPSSSRRATFDRINYAELRDISADARFDRVWWLPGGRGGPLRQRHHRADRSLLAALPPDLPVITVLPFGVPEELAYPGPLVRIPQLSDSADGEWRHLLDAAVAVRADLARRGITATTSPTVPVADAREIARILTSSPTSTCTVHPYGAEVEIPTLVAQRLDALKLFAESDYHGEIKPRSVIDESTMRTFAKTREAEYHARREALHAEARTAARSADRITTRPGGPTHRALGAGAPPIVIINALGQGEGYWWPLIATLAPRHRILLCQQPATGGLTDQLADLTALLAAEQIGQCHLVGWCTGAKLAARFAREQPKRALSLTMLAADFRHNGRDPELDGPYERNLAAVCQALLDRPELADRLAVLFAANTQPGPAATDAQLGPAAIDAQPGSAPGDVRPGPAVAYGQPGAPAADDQQGSAVADNQRGPVVVDAQRGSAAVDVQPGSAVDDARHGPAAAAQLGPAAVDAILATPDPELAQEIRAPFASGAALLAYARQLVEFWSYDELPTADAIRCPTLFLIGDHDEIVAPAAERAAAAAFPQALHAEFALGSHYLMYEQPELIADVIADFLRDPASCADRAGGLRWGL
ncbi:MAG TPA: hypothetical protein VGN81_25995 [Pseudonocardiaceae bacterium]